MSLQDKLNSCVLEAKDDPSELIVGDYTTQHFKICGSSTGMVKNAHLECAELEELAILEDAFLKLERDTMIEYRKNKRCNDVGDEMTEKSNQIIQILGRKPDHHDVHIEQGTKCVGNAPSNIMSLEQLQYKQI